MIDPKSLGASLVLLAVATLSAAAQELRVRAFEETTRVPAVGAIVSLRDTVGRVVVQALTDERGRASLRPPRSGRFLVRIDRIGYLGTTFGPIEVANGPAATLNLAVSPIRNTLPDLTVLSEAPTECTLGGASAELVARLWDEARKTLSASELTNATQPLLQIRRYKRSFAPDGTPTDVWTGWEPTRSSAPFIAADPSRLARRGFHEQASDDHIFYAPDARVLLSDEFGGQHCFSPVSSAGDSTLVGLRFEPTPRYRKRVDVAGTLWLDRATGELRYLEFEHTNIQKELRSGKEGGRIEFLRLPNGGWIVRNWWLRVGNYEHGGEVAAAKANASLGGVTIRGTVYDSLHDRPVPGASVLSGGAKVLTDSTGEYRIVLQEPGAFAIRVESPIFDLVDLRAVAEGAAAGDDDVRLDFSIPSATTLTRRWCLTRPVDPTSEGVLLGRIRDSSGRAEVGAVQVDWERGPVLRAGHRLLLAGGRVLFEVPLGPGGRFMICGVPAGVEVSVRLKDDPAVPIQRTSVQSGGVGLLELTKAQ